MDLGYAIIQLPELVRSLYQWIKIRKMLNHKCLSSRSAISTKTKTKPNDLMKLAKNINSIEVRPCNDGNSFKPCKKDRTWEGELLQLKLQFTSLLEREDKMELRLDNQENKLDEMLALMHAK